MREEIKKIISDEYAKWAETFFKSYPSVRPTQIGTHNIISNILKRIDNI